ncbi:MAG: tagatose 1,6-diphosphate aldolase [Trueperaceae bacterium]|nr:tagatose 1,6-diphosphate aldolase [Trueperaceae bacterium]
MNQDKQQRLKICATDKGIITAAAMDQRGSLRKALKEAGYDASDQDLSDFKVQVSQVLTQHASAILLDPAYGMAAAKARRSGSGLLMSYEESGYDQTQPGRLPDLIPGMSVRRLRDSGTDAIKVLVYYDPFEDAAILEKKHAFVERVGAECEAEGMPFFLEPVSYNDKVSDKLELAKLKPEVLKLTVREFTKPQYRVDVLKLEFPVNVKHVEGLEAAKGNPAVYSKAEAADLVLAATAEATIPYIYLSAGVDMTQFAETLQFAGEAGDPYNGVLCGRATWKGGIAVFAKSGAAALKDWLEGEGVANIKMMNEVLASYAKPLSL